MAAKRFNYFKLGAALVLGPYCFWYATVPGWHFIDGFDLAVHESGHMIFGNFGEFIGVAGGSLMQCLAPALLLLYFCWRRSWFSAVVMGYWVGINLINVSVYAGDAEAQDLPLFGGDDVIHDWNWLLTETNMLSKTKQISHAIYTAGVVVMVISLFFSVVCSRESPDKEEKWPDSNPSPSALDKLASGRGG